jgi:4-hydroxyacetophenone monooxygenase
MTFDKPRDSGLTALTADDDSLRQNILGADLPTLLATVYYLTGDARALRPEWKPALEFGIPVLPAEEERNVRAYCFDRLAALRDSGLPMPQAPSYDDVWNVARWLMGEGSEALVQLTLEEMVVGDHDPRRPRRSKSRVAKSRPFSVGIIGAGESGLLMAIRLRQAGVPFVVYEKNGDVGGTWLENQYPGCRVDCNSFFYSYAFAREVWNDYYGHAADVQAYFARVADDGGIRGHIRFDTEVTHAAWQEDTAVWDVTSAGPCGLAIHSHHVLISAVGQLNRPNYPDIKGREKFGGPHFHSARWDHSIDLTGKRVGVGLVVNATSDEVVFEFLFPDAAGQCQDLGCSDFCSEQIEDVEKHVGWNYLVFRS